MTIVDYDNYKNKEPERIHHFIIALKHSGLESVSDKYWKNHSLQLANILNTTFYGGTVCFDTKHNIVVYRDINDYTYDFRGLRWEDDAENSDFIRIERLGSAIIMFTPELLLGTNPIERKAFMVKEYYSRHKKNGLDWNELVEIIKEYAPKIFTEYDIITDDPFEVMYYKLVMDEVIAPDLYKKDDYEELAWFK